MRVPVLYFRYPQMKLWLDGGAGGREEDLHCTLRDAQDRHYLPGEIEGPLLVRGLMCPRPIYEAARQAGYPLVWMDEYSWLS